VPEPSDSSFDRDEALAALADAIAEEIGGGRTLDLGALASRFRVDVQDVRRVKDVVEAIGMALGEDPAPSAAGALPPPTLPADFELLGEIGRGGMGVVYRVRQRSLSRTVALKVLRPGELFFGDAIRRFQKEAQSLARLRHRHIVSIHEVGESGGQVYYTMDLIEGRSLADLIRSGEMTATRAVRLLRQVAGAISYAHGQGIIHRDLKPANILVDAAGDAYVVDFGLARDAAVQGELTTEGHLLGTPAYMSPEQARGDTARIGEGTDVYSLGAVLYESLTGRAPFEGAPLADVIHAVVYKDPPPLRRIAPKTPRDLEIICQKAMAKEPERRYATVRAMLEDLEHFEEGRPIRARRPSVAYRARRFAGRHAAALAAAGGTGALLLIALLVFVIPRIGKTPETLLATAEELHAAGEHPGAVVLCERALGQHPPKEIEQRVEEALRRCRLEVVRSLEAQGRWSEAQALCENMERRRDGDQDPELLWELSRCLAKKGNREEAGSLLESVKDALERREERNHSDDWDAPQPGPRSNMRVRMLERATPALLDPSDPGHDGAGVLFVQSFGVWHRHDSEVDSWLKAQGNHAVAMVIALLSFLPREYLGTHGDTLHESIEAVKDPRLNVALIAAARDAARPLLARRFAADLLAARLDLPIWFGSWRQDQPGGDDPVLIERAAILAEKATALPARDGFRDRVEAAMSALEKGPHNEDFDVWWISEWLSWHTGFAPKGRKEDDAIRLWKEWWQEHATQEPAQWLTRALKLPSTPALGELLGRYLRCPDLDERTLLHQLLIVSAPSGTPIPGHRFAWGKREPSDRAMEWYRALRGSAADAPYLRRAAHFVFRNGSPDPELEWQEAGPLNVGDEFRTPYHYRSRLQPTQDLRLIVPGLQYERAIPMLERLRSSTWVSLKWKQGGLFFGEGGNPQGILVAGDLYQKERRDDGSIATEADLSVALPPGSDPKEWTLADWKAKIQEDLKFLLEGLRSDAGNRDGPFFMRYQQSFRIFPQLAAHFSLPDAKDLLRTLDETAKTHRYLKDERWSWVPARLLAGDAMPLAQAGTKGEIEKALKETRSTSGYALRLYQGSTDPKLREFALDLLREREIADGVSLALRPRLGSDAPAWLVQRADQAEARNASEVRLPRLRNQAIAVAWAALALGLLLLSVWPGRSYRTRLQAAALLVIVGLVGVAVVCELDGFDLLHDSAGYALIALGCAILSKRARGRACRLPAGFFAVASALYGVAGMVSRGGFHLYGFSVLAAAAGIATLPLLIVGLDRASARPRSRRRWLLIGLFPPAILVFALFHAAAWIEPMERASRSLFQWIGALPQVVSALTFLASGSLFSAAWGLARRMGSDDRPAG
jgi:hypothetical protein